jgi:hypothetical protein
LYCSDTDPTNASFARFKALNVENILITDKNMVVNEGMFGVLVEHSSRTTAKASSTRER